MPLLEHCFAPGVHTPVQAPPTHAWLLQAAPSCQVPVGSQVCTTSPLHCVAPGLHVPEHAPPLHRAWQGVSLCQVALLSQFCGVKPSHIRVPGSQTPVQAPLLHRNGHVSTGVVVKRSMPHSITSLSTQNRVPPVLPRQSVTIG